VPLARVAWQRARALGRGPDRGDHLAIARAGHQAVVLCDSTVLISGGTTAPRSAEHDNPPPDGRR